MKSYTLTIQTIRKDPKLLLSSWSVTWTVLDSILRLSSVSLHSEEAKQAQEQDITSRFLNQSRLDIVVVKENSSIIQKEVLRPPSSFENRFGLLESLVY